MTATRAPEVAPLAAHQVAAAQACDGSFVTEGRLVPRLDGDALAYDIVPEAARAKQHGGEVGLERYLGRDDAAAFLATVDGAVAGYIALSTHWNGYAYVHELVVDARFRRCGVGRALIERGVEWARVRRLPGLMLETQDINVGACRFYQRAGFVLGGFDRFLYRCLPPVYDETALFWYRLLPAP